jgi:hypothetical protein
VEEGQPEGDEDHRVDDHQHPEAAAEVVGAHRRSPPLAGTVPPQPGPGWRVPVVVPGPLPAAVPAAAVHTQHHQRAEQQEADQQQCRQRSAHEASSRQDGHRHRRPDYQEEVHPHLGCFQGLSMICTQPAFAL